MSHFFNMLSKTSIFFINVAVNFDFLNFHFMKVGQTLRFHPLLMGQVGNQFILPLKI